MRTLAKSTDWVEGISAYGEYAFGYRPAPHHLEMLDFIATGVKARRNTIVLEPRGAAKTTWGNTILISWLLAMFPDTRIGLISNTATQAYDFSRAVRWTYEANAKHRDVFGDCVSKEKWRDMEWLHRLSRWHGSKDVSLYAAGAGGAIISKRFDIIICDDILDAENSETPEMRAKVENWFFRTLMPCLASGGVVVVLGTRWAEDDLHDILSKPIAKGGKGWRAKIVHALDEKDDAYSSYWPQEWPVSRLLELRADLGTPMFMCAYQNDLSGLLAGDVFQSRYFQYYEELPEHVTIRMGVDLASSEKERADYTARVTTAEDDKGNFYVMSYNQAKLTTGHAAFINEGWSVYPRMALVLVEDQQFQSTLVQEVMRDYPRIPIEGKRSDVDKTTRARAVAAKYEAHKVFHHVSLRDSEFERTLLSFPKGHDDIPDALGFSMDMGGGGLFFGSLRR